VSEADEQAEDEYSAEEPQLIKERDQAHKAKMLLGNEMVKDALEDMRANYVAALLAARVDDDEGIKGVKMLLAQLDTFEKHFEQMIQTGKLADKRLQVIAQIRERADDGVSWFGGEMSPGERV